MKPIKHCPDCLEEIWDVSTIDQHLNKCWKCGLKFLDDIDVADVLDEFINNSPSCH
jgi:hypothetical protein